KELLSCTRYYFKSNFASSVHNSLPIRSCRPTPLTSSFIKPSISNSLSRLIRARNIEFGKSLILGFENGSAPGRLMYYSKALAYQAYFDQNASKARQPSSEPSLQL